MTAVLTPPVPAPVVALAAVPVIPDSAPFTPAQRAWLNGFFAGLFSRGPAPAATAPTTTGAPAIVADEADDAMPWHDPALPMDERLTLAEGKPVARRLMAAMAQLDCGACGHVCQTYAEAIASGEDTDLTKCAPGGRETAKKLKELLATVPAENVTVRGKPVAPSDPSPASSSHPAPPKRAAHDRKNPVLARLLGNQSLNAPGSAKDTRHIVFDLHGSGLTYKAGDALGVIPENCPDTVDWILEALDASGAEDVTLPSGATKRLRDALQRELTITQATGDMVKLLAASAADPQQAAALNAMLAEDSPGVPEGTEILDLLKQFPSARPEVYAFVAALRPLRPRLYSISSSPAAHGDEVHLTVGVVRYLNPLGRQCKGVASTYLAERLRPGQKAKVFVHASHGFAPPAPDAPMIMVGPGTGIAPFRAFLHDRSARHHRGRNWLFFGDQRREHDFLYREEIESFLLDGLLTRLDVAFSRDQKEKVYVQHRLLERGREVWAWLQDGAHFYVCGDAKRMAKDVDAALKQIIAEHGGMSAEDAAAYVSELSRSKRYCRDVY
jgi:sulfite reductase (NADPH) flavoprotein alpha-component